MLLYLKHHASISAIMKKTDRPKRHVKNVHMYTQSWDSSSYVCIGVSLGMEPTMVASTVSAKGTRHKGGLREATEAGLSGGGRG